MFKFTIAMTIASQLQNADAGDAAADATEARARARVLAVALDSAEAIATDIKFNELYYSLLAAERMRKIDTKPEQRLNPATRTREEVAANDAMLAKIADTVPKDIAGDVDAACAFINDFETARSLARKRTTQRSSASEQSRSAPIEPFCDGSDDGWQNERMNFIVRHKAIDINSWHNPKDKDHIPEYQEDPYNKGVIFKFGDFVVAGRDIHAADLDLSIGQFWRQAQAEMRTDRSEQVPWYLKEFEEMKPRARGRMKSFGEHVIRFEGHDPIDEGTTLRQLFDSHQRPMRRYWIELNVDRPSRRRRVRRRRRRVRRRRRSRRRRMA